MKKLIVILIIITSCSSNSIGEDIDCNCRLKTEKITVVNNGGVFTTQVITSYRPYDSTNCLLNGDVIFKSNTEARTIVCN